MQFEKQCGKFTLEVGDPSPSWVTIKWEGCELQAQDKPFEDGCHRAHIKVEDLRDLRYLIDRALAE